jgi:hypothetical protein
LSGCDVMKEYTDKELIAMDRGTFGKLFFRRFKKFLRHAHDPMQSLMCFGFETHQGWNAIIWRLTESIEKVKGKHKEFEIVQVKEKFGGLRYYVEGARVEEVFNLINKAEELSYKICEECGEPGSLDERYFWYLTLCRKCKAARKKKEEAKK